jgi:NAD-dependent dihydropyrimidine dehydrogenase PreA subunit
MNNLQNPSRRVLHASLARLNTESAYKSICPVCPRGILLVVRHRTSFVIVNLDQCITCGQKFIYEDKFINGEPVMDLIAGMN